LEKELLLKHIDSNMPLKNVTTGLNPELYKYILSVSLRDPEVLQRLKEETSKHELAEMQTAVDEAQFMSLLIKMMNAKMALEVGVFTGYSSLTVALALPEDGKLIACDVSEEFTNVAKKYWKEAKVDHKVDLRIAPGVETLDKLIAEGRSGTFDFAFIDADKPNYDNYYERILQLLRVGGVILFDNVLWHNKIIDDTNQEDTTVALRKLNAKLHKDERVDISMLSIGDGVTIVRKR